MIAVPATGNHGYDPVKIRRVLTKKARAGCPGKSMNRLTVHRGLVACSDALAADAELRIGFDTDFGLVEAKRFLFLADADADGGFEQEP